MSQRQKEAELKCKIAGHKGWHIDMKVVDGKPLLTAYCKRCIGARSISNEQINALVEVALYGGDYSRVKEKYFSDDS